MHCCISNLAYLDPILSRVDQFVYIINRHGLGEVTPRMYIYILLDTVGLLATDVNKYSLASARCQPIWRTRSANWIYFYSCCKGLWDVFLPKPITTKHQSVFWLVSQSRRMSAICVGSCRWISLAAACADPVVVSNKRPTVPQ